MTDIVTDVVENTHTLDASGVAELIAELQAHGLRSEVSIDSRVGGAGPADAGMLWIDGAPATVPTTAAYVANSPYALRQEDDGFGIYRGNTRLADAALAPRPKYYDLTTADGIPYSKIALMHLDSMASTVLQTCAYWGNSDQCMFCGIGVTLAAGRTIAKKTPEMLAEVSIAARDLDGAVDATLTTGSIATPDRGALYVGPVLTRSKRPRACPSRSSSSRLPTSTSSTACATSARTRWEFTSRLSTRRCWRGSRPARPAGVSTPTSRPGNVRSRRSARARCRPTSSSAWVRTRR